MILRQFLHTEPVVAASYLVGCGGHGVAAVIDPVSAPSAYLDAARALGLRVVCVADTHAHADHLSTGRDLARAAGCDYLLHASAPARFPFRRAEDGDTIALGNVELQLLLTGHTLMVGDVGRVELASDLDTGAAALHDSLARLLTLPDHLLIYPGAL